MKLLPSLILRGKVGPTSFLQFSVISDNKVNEGEVEKIMKSSDRENDFE